MQSAPVDGGPGPPELGQPVEFAIVHQGVDKLLPFFSFHHTVKSDLIRSGVSLIDTTGLVRPIEILFKLLFHIFHAVNRNRQSIIHGLSPHL